MSTLTTKIMLLAGIAISLIAAEASQASVLYNTNGGSNLVGLDGQLPPTWVGSESAPVYGGSMDVMWYANLSDQTVNLSTANAIASGSPSDFILGFGPKAWSNVLGHGLDYGLIHLNTASNLTITIAADSSNIVPGFSLYQGWDTGTTFVRTAAYINNIDNPLGTVGLTYLGQASTTVAGGSAAFTFSNLSGDYTLMLGGNNGAAGGKYQATLIAAPVPVPGAVWLFASALAGMVSLSRRGK